MKKYSGCMCTFANQIKTIKLFKYEKMQVNIVNMYTQQKKFCTNGCSGKFCLDQEWLHLMFYMVV